MEKDNKKGLDKIKFLSNSFLLKTIIKKFKKFF